MSWSLHRRIAGAARAGQRAGQKGLGCHLIIRFRLWHHPQTQPQECLELSHSHRRQATAKHLLPLHSPRALYLGVAGRRLLRLGRLVIMSIREVMRRIPLLGSLRAQAEGCHLDADLFCFLSNRMNPLLHHGFQVYRACPAHLQSVNRRVLAVVLHLHLLAVIS